MRRIAFALTLLLASPASAQMMLGPSDNVEAALNGLSPGDEVVLADGMYMMTERFSFTAIGTESEPIIIRAAEGATPHFNRPNANQNIWDIENAEHVVIRGLTFSGGSAGLRVSGATNLTIEECEIFDTEDVALRINDGGVTYSRVQIIRNHIHDTGGTGEGMYLGCNDDGCRIAGGLVAYNYVHHTDAGDVSQGDGIELKDGSFGVTIRGNVIHDTNYPCILGYSTAGNGEPNVVEGNVMWNCGDHGIQWEADATVRNNIVLGAAGAAMATQPHQENGPSSLTIVHNTFINDGDALAIRNPSGSVTVANNALYSMGRALFLNGDAGRVTAEGNAGVGSVQGLPGVMLIAGDIGADFGGASFSGSLPQDVFPTMGGVLGGAGVGSHVTMFDFNGVDRMGVADIGAYALGDGSNPGAPIAEDFRPPPGMMMMPGTDAGPPMPGVDAGPPAPGVDAGPPIPGVDAGPPVDGGGDDGCSCRVGAPSSRRAPALFGLLVLGLFLVRRRRLV